ncbi:MAG: 30S ribosomal protein S4 [Chloroflexota bacterium]|nr:30S ribosomal protein S4 [Chloroflexota bacterium]
MARYTGPSCRLCRYLGEKLMLKGERCLTPKCSLEKRNAPPGKHSTRRGRKISDRGLQLREKQKARFSYGVLERQFRKFFAEAARTPGATGENLFTLLERRLDNVVYRLGFADSRAQARQIVLHGHIVINSRKVDIPSYLVKAGDLVQWREASTKTEYYQKLTQNIKGRTTPNWLSLDEEKVTGRVLSLPGKEDIETKFDGKAIVEYYSK